MLFVGQFDYTVDLQGRINLPGEWRSDGSSAAFILVPEGADALVLMPEDDFLSFFTELQKLSLADPDLRLAAARLGAVSRSCRCDRQGRLTLPRTQLENAGISKSIKLIGAVTHIRICAPEKWDVEGIDRSISGKLKRLERIGNDNGALAALIEGVMDHE